MGMYTEIYVRATFDMDKTPEDIINIINYMVNGYDEDKQSAMQAIVVIRGHPLFNTSRWDFMLQSSSYYHQPRSTRNFWYDEISNSWYLCCRSDFKNYDNEANLFFDWISKYCDEGGSDSFIGYTLYEEDDTPKLFYSK